VGMQTLLVPNEVDQMLRWPRGRALKLARLGKLRSITLPDGSMRFALEDLNQMLIQGGLGAALLTGPKQLARQDDQETDDA
jgi:hypothetical protein